MARHMLFPDVGEGITEGVLVKWLVAQGQAVKEDQPVAEIETDKAVVEIPSREHGTILKLWGKPGDTLKVHTPLITVGALGEPIPEYSAAAKKEEGAAKPAAPTQRATSPAPSTQPQAPMTASAILAPPSVRALARQLGVDLANVKGSGPGGRITNDDVQNAKSGIGSPASDAAAPALLQEKKPAMDLGTGKRLPLSHLRKTIASRMSYSWKHNAHVFYFDECDFGELLFLREKMRGNAEKQGVKLTPLAFILKALAKTLQDFPTLNAALDEEKMELVMHDYVNIAFGVDTEDGLVAPVLKNAHQKGVLAIAKEVRELAEKARERKLSLDDFKGGTITVTNLGSVGGAFVSAVINPPEAAILGVYRTKEKPAVKDGKIVIRPLTYLGITFDHRVADGAYAGRFMNALVEKLENPGWLEGA